jgi:PAS domain S-box-containing protein
MHDSDATSSSQIIKDAEARLRLALDSVGDGSWDWNVQTGEVFYSDRWIELLGYSRSDAPPYISFWESLLHPEDRERVWYAINEHFDGKAEHFESEYRTMTSSGEYRWSLDRGRVLQRDDEGRAIRMAGTCFDISNRKRAESVLRQTEARFRAIVETAGCVIVALDKAFRVTEWNPAAEEVYGWKRSEVLGKPYVERFLPEATRGLVIQEIQRILAGGQTKNFENPIITRDGGERAILWNATPSFDNHGQVSGVIAIGQDITEWKRAEEQRLLALQEKELALDRVRVLSQPPIESCRVCEMIRYEDGGWTIETRFVSPHTLASLHRGICPGCKQASKGRSVR